MNCEISSYIKSSKILKGINKQLNLIEVEATDILLFCKYVDFILKQANALSYQQPHILQQTKNEIARIMNNIYNNIEKFNANVNKGENEILEPFSINCSSISTIGTTKHQDNINVLREYNVNLYVIIKNLSQILDDCKQFRQKMEHVTNLFIRECNGFQHFVAELDSTMKTICISIYKFSFYIMNKQNSLSSDDVLKPKHIINDKNKIFETLLSINFDCPICLENFKIDSMVIPECNISHAVCRTCAKKIQKEHCSLCRAQIQQYIQIDKIGENIKFTTIPIFLPPNKVPQVNTVDDLEYNSTDSDDPNDPDWVYENEDINDEDVINNNVYTETQELPANTHVIRNLRRRYRINILRRN